MTTQATTRAWSKTTERTTPMKRLVVAAVTLIAALGLLATPQLISARADTSIENDRGGRHGFDRFLHRYEAANEAFLNGDADQWLSMTTDQNPASIFGGFGGLGESGVAEVDERYRLAEAAFRPSGAELDVEYLVKDVRGKLAYTVAIESSEVLYAGQSETKPQVLRVTMIFRFERGTWRIVHRHADMMIELQLPPG